MARAIDTIPKSEVRVERAKRPVGISRSELGVLFSAEFEKPLTVIHHIFVPEATLPSRATPVPQQADLTLHLIVEIALLTLLTAKPHDFLQFGSMEIANGQGQQLRIVARHEMRMDCPKSTQQRTGDLVKKIRQAGPHDIAIKHRTEAGCPDIAGQKRPFPIDQQEAGIRALGLTQKKSFASVT